MTKLCSHTRSQRTSHNPLQLRFANPRAAVCNHSIVGLEATSGDHRVQPPSTAGSLHWVTHKSTTLKLWILALLWATTHPAGLLLLSAARKISSNYKYTTQYSTLNYLTVEVAYLPMHGNNRTHDSFHKWELSFIFHPKVLSSSISHLFISSDFFNIFFLWPTWIYKVNTSF